MERPSDIRIDERRMVQDLKKLLLILPYAMCIIWVIDTHMEVYYENKHTN